MPTALTHTWCVQGVGKDEKKKRRWKSGTVSLRDIKKQQRSTELLVKKKPMGRLIREVLQQRNAEMRISTQALKCLHTASEDYLINLMQKSCLMSVHANRRVVNKKDMRGARMATGEIPIDYNH